MAAVLWILLWFVMDLLSLIHGFYINDFQIGIQLCDGNAGENVGPVHYTPWFRNHGGSSPWASDNDYMNPDGIRIGLFGRYNTAIGEKEFSITDTDICFCIQLTDNAKHEFGNYRYEGTTKCTPWASEGGGWSEFAGDINYKNFDAVSVKLETRYLSGLLITDIQTGVRVTDDGSNPENMGYNEYTDYLIGSQSSTSTWSGWAGDNDFYNPDAIRIFLGVHMSLGNSDKRRKRTWKGL
eukprot:425757_1